ncbi:hypothetical protein Tco_1506423 [Tanacetum coccineum]
MVKIHTDKNVANLLTNAFDNGIGVNAGDSKLMLLGINLLLLGKVNVARNKLTTAVEILYGEDLDNAGKCLMYPRIKRKDTEISQSSGPTDNVADKVVYKEKDDSLDASKQGRKIDDIDKDVEIILVHEIQGSVDEVTLAQALATLKSAKVQEKPIKWDDIQAKVEVECILAETVTRIREQEELTIEERAKLFQQLLGKRRKLFAAKRAEEKRNRPPTRA